MKMTDSKINAIIESAIFYRKCIYNPMRPSSVETCEKIDDFCSRLRSHKLLGFTRGEAENCCLFLSEFIDASDHPEQLTVQRSVFSELENYLHTQS